MNKADQSGEIRAGLTEVDLKTDFGEIARQATLEILREGKTKAKVRELAANANWFVGHVVAMIEKELGSHLESVACQEGCRFCCYHQIITSPPEALLIEDYLVNNFTEHDWKGLIFRVRKNLRLIEGKDTNEILKTRHLLPCIFLRGNRCSIYPVRPMGCRAWSSNNVEQCRKGFESKDPLAGIGSYLHRQRLSVAIHTGILLGTQEMGLESGFLDLVRAAKIIVNGDRDTLGKKWLEGERVFSSVMDYRL